MEKVNNITCDWLLDWHIGARPPVRVYEFHQQIDVETVYYCNVKGQWCFRNPSCKLKYKKKKKVFVKLWCKLKFVNVYQGVDQPWEYSGKASFLSTVAGLLHCSRKDSIITTHKVTPPLVRNCDLVHFSFCHTQYTKEQNCWHLYFLVTIVSI